MGGPRPGPEPGQAYSPWLVSCPDLVELRRVVRPDPPAARPEPVPPDPPDAPPEPPERPPPEALRRVVVPLEALLEGVEPREALVLEAALDDTDLARHPEAFEAVNRALLHELEQLEGL